MTRYCNACETTEGPFQYIYPTVHLGKTPIDGILLCTDCQKLDDETLKERLRDAPVRARRRKSWK